MYESHIARFLSEDPIGTSEDETNLYRYVDNNPPTDVDPSALKKAVWIEYEGCWKYVPFFNGECKWELDDREIVKLQELADFIDRMFTIISFLRKNKKAIQELGIGEKQLEKTMRELRDAAMAAGAYGRAIQAWKPSTLCRPGVVSTFDFADFEGRKPGWQKMFNAFMRGFSIGAEVGLSEGGNQLGIGARIGARARRVGIKIDEIVDASSEIAKRAGQYGDDVVIQGSRLRGKKGPDVDLDLGIRVSKDKFDECIKQRFGKPTPGSAKERTMRRAIESGKIQAGEAGLSGLRKQLEKICGTEVDISIICKGGAFDAPSIPLH